jgi:hypothetical protein
MVSRPKVPPPPIHMQPRFQDQPVIYNKKTKAPRPQATTEPIPATLAMAAPLEEALDEEEVVELLVTFGLPVTVALVVVTPVLFLH